MCRARSSTLVWLLTLTAVIVPTLQGQISGVVRDSVGNGIPDVTVTLSGDSGRVATQRSDVNGAFSFTRGESVGAVSITAQAEGYQAVLRMLSSTTQVVELRMRGAGFGVTWHAEIARGVAVTLVREGGQRWELGEVMGQISAPEPLRAGETFTLQLTSHGSGSCTRADRVVTTADSEYLTVVVIDQVKGGACTMDRAAFPREVSHRFDMTGAKVVRIVGVRNDLVISISVIAG